MNLQTLTIARNALVDHVTGLQQDVNHVRFNYQDNTELLTSVENKLAAGKAALAEMEAALKETSKSTAVDSQLGYTVNSQLVYSAAAKRRDLEAKHFPEGVTPDMIRLLDDVEGLLVKAYAADQPEAWSNQACFGYSILAAERAGLTPKKIEPVIKGLHRIFDEVSVDEAAAHYRNSNY